MKIKVLALALALSALTLTANADEVWTYQGNSVSGSAHPDLLNPCNCALEGTLVLDNSNQVMAWNFSNDVAVLTNFNSTGAFSFNEILGHPFEEWRIQITGIPSLNSQGFLSQFYGSIGEATDSGSNMDVEGNKGSWAEKNIDTPEPATALLLGAGMGFLALFRRRPAMPKDNTVWEPLA